MSEVSLAVVSMDTMTSTKLESASISKSVLAMSFTNAKLTQLVKNWMALTLVNVTLDSEETVSQAQKVVQILMSVLRELTNAQNTLPAVILRDHTIASAKEIGLETDLSALCAQAQNVGTTIMIPKLAHPSKMKPAQSLSVVMMV